MLLCCLCGYDSFILTAQLWSCIPPWSYTTIYIAILLIKLYCKYLLTLLHILNIIINYRRVLCWKKTILFYSYPSVGHELFVYLLWKQCIREYLCLNSLLNIFYYFLHRRMWGNGSQKWYYWIKCMNK